VQAYSYLVDHQGKVGELNFNVLMHPMYLKTLHICVRACGCVQVCVYR